MPRVYGVDVVNNRYGFAEPQALNDAVETRDYAAGIASLQRIQSRLLSGAVDPQEAAEFVSELEQAVAIAKDQDDWTWWEILLSILGLGIPFLVDKLSTDDHETLLAIADEARAQLTPLASQAAATAVAGRPNPPGLPPPGNGGAPDPVRVRSTPTGRGDGKYTFSTASVSQGERGKQKPDGSWDRGWVEVTDVRATAKGCRFTARTHNSSKDDPVSLVLQARVNNGTEEKVIWLDVLAHQEVINRGSFDGKATFEIDYDKINEYLQTNAPGLRLSAGTPLAVYCQWWSGSGGNFYPMHQWGGFTRPDGVFNLPQRLRNPLSAPTTVKGRNPLSGADLPTLVAVNYSPTVTANYSALAASVPDPTPADPTHKRPGQFTSHHEVELKAEIPVREVPAIYRRIIELQDPQKLKAVLGDGWKLERVERYYQRDPAGALLQQPNGLPVANPIIDRCSDNDKFELAEHGIVMRFRERKGDPIGTVDLKFPRTHIGDNIMSGVEYGWEVIPGVKDDPTKLAGFLESPEDINGARYTQSLVPGFSFWRVAPRIELVAQRYKFHLTHENGAKAELSLDDVFAYALDATGQRIKDAQGVDKVARFANLELEYDHMDFTTAPDAIGGTATAASLREFDSEAEQQKWLKAVPATATLSGPIQIHGPKDATRPEYVKTPGIAAMRDVAVRLQRALVQGGKPPPARPKTQEAARRLGLVPSLAPTPAEEALYAADLAARAKIDAGQ